MVEEGDLLWTPSEARVAGSHMRAYMDWLAREEGCTFADYDALWRWSVDDIEAFWASLWRFFDIISDGEIEQVRTGTSMEDSRWFAGARLNYAEHLLRREAKAESDEIALTHLSEIRPLATTTWHALGDQVRAVATALRAMGIGPGDRVAAYLPNVPETVVAMLATVAVGAVWSVAAPEFGARTVVDRFSQIAPRLLFATDGYAFGGKQFDRREEVRTMLEALDSVETVVWLPYLGLDPIELPRPSLAWADLASTPAPDRTGFRFERVGSDHPLWVLFSSGTTGLPKAITHSHVGIVLDHLKQMVLHYDLKPGKAMFFYTTTGWMMWNAVVGALFAGAAAVLYDGSPTWPAPDRVLEISAISGATCIGASGTLVAMYEKAGLRPCDRYDVSRIDSIVLGGAPATPAAFAWLYANLKRDLWVMNASGGTDLCGGIAGPSPLHPVHAGELQCRMLGLAAEAWSDEGAPLIDAVGELVITRPFPSAPLCFWGDEGGRRLHETYYSDFPGVWRHGDFVKITAAGGVYVYGRADATLNRYGVRIGTAELYGALADIPEVVDAIVVCCETGDGGYYMPLFVKLAPGHTLDEALCERMRSHLRQQTSPRHVPDRIFAVDDIPYTLTGKKMEVPLRKVIMGADAAAVSTPDAMMRRDGLDWYARFAARDEVRALFARVPASPGG